MSCGKLKFLSCSSFVRRGDIFHLISLLLSVYCMNFERVPGTNMWLENWIQLELKFWEDFAKRNNSSYIHWMNKNYLRSRRCMMMILWIWAFISQAHSSSRDLEINYFFLLVTPRFNYFCPQQTVRHYCFFSFWFSSSILDVQDEFSFLRFFFSMPEIVHNCKHYLDMLVQNVFCSFCCKFNLNFCLTVNATDSSK